MSSVKICVSVSRSFSVIAWVIRSMTATFGWVLIMSSIARACLMKRP